VAACVQILRQAYVDVDEETHGVGVSRLRPIPTA
jgi:hypothetical protein